MSVFLQNERYDSLLRLYGAENVLKLRKSRILVVGAGGIGEITITTNWDFSYFVSRFNISFCRM